MKIWMFIFPARSEPYAALRVAAPTMNDAEALAGDLDPAPDFASQGIVRQYAGEAHGQEARVLASKGRDV